MGMVYDGAMNVLILGGNSIRHKQWVRDAQAALAPYFDEVRFADYKHWETGDELADVPYEINAAHALVTGWDDYAVVGKSVGTIIAALGHAKGALKAKRYILLGIPYSGVAGTAPEFEPSLRTLPSTVVLQNTNDPYGSAGDVRARLDKLALPSLRLIETPGDTHDYLDFELIKNLLPQ